MALADTAMLAKLQGNHARYRNFIKRAFAYEKQAADLCADDLSLEPTRSVLHRSAASMGMECGLDREAEQLIGRALSGEPPQEIAEQLRDLMEQVWFERHLRPASQKKRGSAKTTNSIMVGSALSKSQAAEPGALSGVLRYADDLSPRTRKIQVIDDTGRAHAFTVPDGMMDDIVRPLWGTRVTVRWRTVRHRRILNGIQPDKDSAAE